LYTITVSVL